MNNNFSTTLKNTSVMIGFIATIGALVVYLMIPLVKLDDNGIAISEILSDSYYRDVFAGGLTSIVMYVPIVALVVSLVGFVKCKQNLIVRGAAVALVAVLIFPVMSLFSAVDYVKDTVASIFAQFFVNQPEMDNVSIKTVFEFLATGFWVTIAALLISIFTIETTPYYVFEAYEAPTIEDENANEQGVSKFCTKCGAEYEVGAAKFCKNCGCALPKETNTANSIKPTVEVNIPQKTKMQAGNVCKACGAALREQDEECPLCGMPK